MSQAVAVRVDSKGRVSLPKQIREKLSVKAGDLFFLKPKGRILHLAKAENPFDALAEHATKEYREGRTRSLREFAKEHGLRRS